jgi:hypothetical protein
MNCWGLSTSKPKRKKKRKRKQNIAETGGSKKMKMTHNRCVHRRIPTTLLASTLKRHVPRTPLRRKAMTTMLIAHTYPRVSPGTLRGIEKRYTRCPSGRKGDTRKLHHVGVETTGISSKPQKTTPLMIQSAPPSMPPTNAPP